jgi:acetyl-CoA C-acetyltransferase
MSDIVIAGIGQVPVGEHFELSLRTLASRATRAALRDAGSLKPDALYIGNFLAGVLSHQTNLGALVSDHSNLTGIEAYSVEAAGGSGGAALHTAYMAVASGYVDVAIALGVEKVTDMVGPEVEDAIAQQTDYDYEGIQGLTPAGQAAMLMQRYLHQYQPPRSALGGFALLAHANAAGNPNAMYRKAIKQEAYDKAAMVNDPLNLFDVAPYADGAAAVVVTRRELLPKDFAHPVVRISGSSLVIETLALHDRPDPLAFMAADVSIKRACSQAGILPADVNLFELSDDFSIYAILTLEAAGFASCGEGWKLAQDGSLNLTGRLPILTMGGSKARGNPLGAKGIYQVVEAVLQLRGQAGANQVVNARRAMVQDLAGPAATATTHILTRFP